MPTKKMQQLPTFINIAQEGFEVLREQSQLFLKLTLIGYLPILLVVMWMQYSMFSSQGMPNPGQDYSAEAMTAWFVDIQSDMVVPQVIMSISAFWGSFMSVVITYAAGLYFLDKKKLLSSTPVDLMTYCVGKLPSLISTHFISFLALIFLFLLFIVPGLIFSVYWMFLTQVILFSNLSGTEAMSHSKALVSGRWWMMFRYLVGLGFLAIAISFMMGWVTQSVMELLPSSLLFLSNLLSIATQFLTVAITISTTSLYLKLDKIGPVRK